jgi:hypothetical protein
LIETLFRHLPEVHAMALFASPAPFVRSFSFPDGEHHVNGGCAVVVARGRELGCPVGNHDDADDFVWGDKQTAAFLAGEPVTLGWVSQSPANPGSEGAYICCWITIDND